MVNLRSRVIFSLTVCVLIVNAVFAFDGGNGTVKNPYQISTPEHLISIGSNPDLLDKHYIMVDDVNMAEYVFDTAVIGPDGDSYYSFKGVAFSGCFDGNEHIISNLNIELSDDDLNHIGFFGKIDKSGKVKNLFLDSANIYCEESAYVGILAGGNSGTVYNCHTEGTVNGESTIGGLIGYNEYNTGNIERCSSAVDITGDASIGCLVGWNGGYIFSSFSTGSATGGNDVGGLAGSNNSEWKVYNIINCYSTAAVTGNEEIGGLLGSNEAFISNCYSAGSVVTDGVEDIGGMIGRNWGAASNCFWDVETSGMLIGNGGIGLTTEQMKQGYYYTISDWPESEWVIDEGNDYPRLAWENTGANPIHAFVNPMKGSGTDEDPFVIKSKGDLEILFYNDRFWDKSFILEADIDLSREVYDRGLIGYDYPLQYTGTFDGNGHRISNLRINGHGNLGLFRYIGGDGSVNNLGLVDVNIVGSGDEVGCLAGYNEGYIKSCYSTGSVIGNNEVGGLIGNNYYTGYVLNCHSDCSVAGNDNIGGLTGYNEGIVTSCYSAGTVEGNRSVGGLIGYNDEEVKGCYSTSNITATGQSSGGIVGYNDHYGGIVRCYANGSVNGQDNVGGLVGFNNNGYGYEIANCYSTGAVSGNYIVGGLIGKNWGSVKNCFWDVETSGINSSAEGVGKTTVEMQTMSTFVDAGWDFEDILTDRDEAQWQIVPGSYPTQIWQQKTESFQFEGGDGSEGDPYRISSIEQLLSIGSMSILMDKHFLLTVDIDMSGYEFTTAIIASDGEFHGTFDGDGYVIRNLKMLTEDALEPGHREWKLLGLFGQIGYYGTVKRLGIVDANISGGNEHSCVGILAGYNNGTIIDCYSTGHSTNNYNGWAYSIGCGGLIGVNAGIIENSHAEVSANSVDSAGGLVGYNSGTVSDSYSTGDVTGKTNVGGLVGNSVYMIHNSYSNASVIGDSSVGGLVGGNSSYYGVDNYSYISNCYSTGLVNGNDKAGGFIGSQNGLCEITDCFWDIESSGITTSDGGMGLDTIQMQQASIYSLNGWGGTLWTIDEGNDYPRLAWEGYQGVYISDPIITMQGTGTVEDPLIINSREDFLLVCSGTYFFDKSMNLNADINLSGIGFNKAPLGFDNYNVYKGSFDGNGHVISNLMIEGENYLGLFGFIGMEGAVRNLGVVNADIKGTGNYIGGLAGLNERGPVENCYSSGIVSGNNEVGGLIGSNGTTVTTTGVTRVISGGPIINCYSSSYVSGYDKVGGLIGFDACFETLNCYSVGQVSGKINTGGLLGSCANFANDPKGCFWDIETSGISTGYNCTMTGVSIWLDILGKTTEEMQTISTFTDAGWDFSDNDGDPADWQMIEDYYPLLKWQRVEHIDIPEVIGLEKSEAEAELDSNNINVVATYIYSDIAATGVVVSQWPEARVGLLPAGFTVVLTVSKGEGYAGGIGTADKPFEIATAEDLIDLANTPKEYDRHFILTADIDLADYSFTTGVISPDIESHNDNYGGTSFTGSFDGNGHVIKNLTIEGNSFLGLFGCIGEDGTVKNLGLEGVNVSGTGKHIGGLTGYNYGGVIENCYSCGEVTGEQSSKYIGGLVGLFESIDNHNEQGDTGSIENCYSKGTVTGKKNSEGIGGLVGKNGTEYDWLLHGGPIINCYSACTVIGERQAGYIGGLIGRNDYSNWFDINLFDSYSTGSVYGGIESFAVGGLIGENNGSSINCFSTGDVSAGVESFAVGGLIGKNTRSLTHCRSTGDVTNSGNSVGGLIGKNANDSKWSRVIIENCYATGNVSGNLDVGGLIGDNYECIFAYCYSIGSVQGEKNVGGLIGGNHNADVRNCYSNSNVTATGNYVGGLAGFHSGYISRSCSSGKVIGVDNVGGLAGVNWETDIRSSYSTSEVIGNDRVGGLTGLNYGYILNCYSAGSVSGNNHVGGLSGSGGQEIEECYSAASVSGNSNVNGFTSAGDSIESSFWDIEASGIVTSEWGIGKTTEEMKTESTYTDAGWYFGGAYSYYNVAWEMGPDGYPVHKGGLPEIPNVIGLKRKQAMEEFAAAGIVFYTIKHELSSTVPAGEVISQFLMDGREASYSVELTISLGEGYHVTGLGTVDDPWEIGSAEDIVILHQSPEDYNKNFILASDIDISGYTFDSGIIAPDTDATAAGFQGVEFTGSFDGNGYRIRNLVIDTLGDDDIDNDNDGFLGLFGLIGSGGEVRNLCIENSSILCGAGSRYVGCLAGSDYECSVESCYSNGVIEGGFEAGGLIGQNSNSVIRHCYSTGEVTGYGNYIGGLVGINMGDITSCYSTCNVNGEKYVGGLVGGDWYGNLSQSYSIGAVSGNDAAGGLIGKMFESEVTGCFWNTETSGQSTSAGGTALTTSQMQTLSTFTDTGWDFENTWWINDGRDYPKLSWQPFGDLNNDNHVNTADLAIMSASWLNTDTDPDFNSVSELSGDNVIDTADLSALIAAWLAGPGWGD